MVARRLEAANWGWFGLLVGLAMAIGLIAGKDPKLAIGAAIGLGFILLIFGDLATALAIFVAEPLDLGVSSSKVVRIVAVLILLSWLGTMLVRRQARTPFISAHPMMSWILLLFLGWTLFSVTWAADPTAALIQDGGYALGIGIFFIVFTAVYERRQLPLFMGILLAGAVASALYGFVAAPPGESSTFGADRLSSYLDPNELAAILVPAAALSVGIGSLWAKSSGLRLASYAAGAFCLVATFLTVSRGGLIALAVSLAAAVMFGGRWRLRIVVLAVITIFLGVYYIAALAPPQARDRILQTTQGQQQLLEGRTTIWQVGWRMVQANPVKGVGSGNFPIVSRRYVLQPGAIPRSDLIIDTPKVAHNIYLEILAELGVVGLSFFLLIAFFSVQSALRAARGFKARDDPAAELLSRCLAVAILGMLTASFFISIELDKHLWLLLGLGPVLLNISRHGEREVPHRELRPSG